MRMKVTKKQFKLMFDNLHILTEKGMKMEMNGKTFLYLYSNGIIGKSK